MLGRVCPTKLTPQQVKAVVTTKRVGSKKRASRRNKVSYVLQGAAAPLVPFTFADTIENLI